MAVDTFTKWLMAKDWVAPDSGSTAQYRTRNGRPVWRFKPDTGNLGGRSGDDGIQIITDIPSEADAFFAGATSGSGIGINLLWTQVAGVTGSVVWKLAFESHSVGDQLDTDSFSAEIVATAAVASVVGYTQSTPIVLTRAQADGILCGEICRIRLIRDDDAAGDTHAGSIDFIAAKMYDVDTKA